MKVRFYRSLDRSVQYFGVKGRFVIPVAAFAIVGLVLGSLVGAINSLLGICTFLLVAGLGVMFVYALQGRFSEKTIVRRLAMISCPMFIRVHPNLRIRRRMARRRLLNAKQKVS